MVHLLDAPIRLWKCPDCSILDRTQRPDVHTQFHNCPALGGISVPLVEVKSFDEKPKARQVVVESEYSHDTAAVRTERMDGSNDVTVFPQPAVGPGIGIH